MPFNSETSKRGEELFRQDSGLRQMPPKSRHDFEREAFMGMDGEKWEVKSGKPVLRRAEHGIFTDAGVQKLPGSEYCDYYGQFHWADVDGRRTKKNADLYVLLGVCDILEPDDRTPQYFIFTRYDLYDCVGDNLYDVDLGILGPRGFSKSGRGKHIAQRRVPREKLRYFVRKIAPLIRMIEEPGMKDEQIAELYRKVQTPGTEFGAEGRPWHRRFNIQRAKEIGRKDWRLLFWA